MHGLTRILRQSATATAVCLATALLAGCAAVGPDYEPPVVETPDAWTEVIATEADPAHTPGLQTWWDIFNDPVLSDLISRARQSNLDLQIAVSRVAEARSKLGIARSAELPGVNLGGGISETKQSDDGELAQIAPPNGFDAQELYQAGFDASWEIDVFGGVRRRVEAAGAAYEATIEDQRDVLVSLLAEVALNYISLRSAQQRIYFAKSNVSDQERALQLATDRFNSGLNSKLDVVQAQSNLGLTRSTIPVLEISQIRALNRLAVLLGAEAGTLQAEFSTSGTIPLPAKDKLIGIGVPADVLRQRPDVRAAERQLAAQTAMIGVATSELYPRFQLSGIIGLQSQTIGNLVDSSSFAWSLGLPFQWNVFDGGRIRSNIVVQEERAKQAGLQYRQSVLLALEEVENAVVGVNQQWDRYRILQDAAASTKEAVRLVTTQYDSGLTDFDNVLNTLRSLFNQQEQSVVSETQVAIEMISLYKALGGGWDYDSDP